jgi:serine protease Do
MPNGKLLPADVYGIHSETDLAMLQVRASSLSEVQFASDSNPQIGQWVASPLPDQKPLVGIVSVNTREIPPSTPFIGIRMDNVEDRDGVRIRFIVSKSPADEAGLWVNDVITSIDSLDTPDYQTLKDVLGQYDPNERITLTIMRGETKKTIKLTLAEKDKASPLNRRSNQQNSMGSRLSRRRKAFPNAFQHDSMLTARNCGGPVVNLEGQVIGINIARAGRVASYSLPVATIEPIVAKLKTGELAPEIVNKEAIEKTDLELAEINQRLGNLPDRVVEIERKIDADEIRSDEINQNLEYLKQRQKQQEELLAQHRKELRSLKDDLKRTEQTKRRLNENRRLLSTGRR